MTKCQLFSIVSQTKKSLDVRCGMGGLVCLVVQDGINKVSVDVIETLYIIHLCIDKLIVFLFILLCSFFALYSVSSASNIFLHHSSVDFLGFL